MQRPRQSARPSCCVRIEGAGGRAAEVWVQHWVQEVWVWVQEEEPLRSGCAAGVQHIVSRADQMTEVRAGMVADPSERKACMQLSYTGCP